MKKPSQNRVKGLSPSEASFSGGGAGYFDKRKSWKKQKKQKSFKNQRQPETEIEVLSIAYSKIVILLAKAIAWLYRKYHLNEVTFDIFTLVSSSQYPLKIIFVKLLEVCKKITLIDAYRKFRNRAKIDGKKKIAPPTAPFSSSPTEMYNF